MNRQLMTDRRQPSSPKDRLIVALDRDSRDEVLRLVDELSGTAGLFKIGLQAFIANGPQLVREVMGRGMKVFLDLKLHDIPNTVAHAAAAAAELGVSMLTVHASGGRSMLKATREAVSRFDTPPMILGVTILTSLDDIDVHSIGFRAGASESAAALALLTAESGGDGVIASPHEITAIRELCGERLTIITPGIRPAGGARDDQKRAMTPREAIAAGADYIVVGRPITESSNPADAARRIVDELS